MVSELKVPQNKAMDIFILNNLRREKTRFERWILLLAGLQVAACASVGEKPASLASDQDMAVHFIQPLFADMVGDSGEIEKSEIKRVARFLFSEMDSDDSGAASFSEYFRTRPLAEIEEERYIFSLMDVDHSTYVSKREYQLFLYRVVYAADTNKDGLVSDLEAEMGDYQAPKYLK